MLHMKIDPRELERILPERFQRQVPFIISKVMNNTLYEARKDQIGDGNATSGGVIDKWVKGGANRFTRRGMMVVPSRKTSLRGALIFKADRAYMRNTVYGGLVKPPKSRQITPSRDMLQGSLPGNKLTKYGGVKRKTLQKQDLKSYFVGKPKGYRGDVYGLWQRYGPKGNTRIRMILDLAKVNRQAEITYPADKLINEFVRENIQDIAKKTTEEVLATAR